MDIYPDKRQAKLTSVDFLMVILTRLNVCSEHKAMRLFQYYRHELFYRYDKASKHDPRFETNKF